MKMKEKPLQTWIILVPDGSIKTAQCTCKAGLGETCTHAAAICFALLQKLDPEISCTDKLCYWNAPRKSLGTDFKKICDINWGNSPKSYSPIGRYCKNSYC